MTQLTEKIREALLGNVGTIICGRIGVTDAELMVKAFTPTFTAEDLTKTPNFSAVAKVMMFDMPSAPFTISLPPLMGEANVDLMNSLKVYSATKFGKTRAEVEKEIQDRWTASEKQKNAGEGPLKAPEGGSSLKPIDDPLFSANANPSASSGSKKGFLDDWLSKKQPSKKSIPEPILNSTSSPMPELVSPPKPSPAPTPEPIPEPEPASKPEPKPAPAPEEPPEEVVFKIR